VIVPVAGVIRLEAEDNYVRIWADRPYLHKQTLSGLMQMLDPGEFLRVHRSHAVNIRLVRELRQFSVGLSGSRHQGFSQANTRADTRDWRQNRANCLLPFTPAPSGQAAWR